MERDKQNNESQIMGKVISINMDKEIVDTLKRWLDLAKQGRLTALTACLIIDDELDTAQLYGEHSALELLAMTHLTAAEISAGILDADCEEDES